jgi:thiol-disulfide isomerase/thioredoxin
MKNKNTIFKSGTILIVSLLFFVNSFAQDANLRTGDWKGILQLNDSTQLPFNFQVKALSLEIMNGDERIVVDEIKFFGDSVFIKMPVFDSEFRVEMTGDTIMKGNWVNYARKTKNAIPFFASNCFKKNCDDKNVFASSQYFNMSGNWECDFSPNTKDKSKAKGVFIQTDPFKKLTGTFLTETGDYRYLEGKLSEGRHFFLSCFDGSHAFLFTGKVKGDSIVEGHFYSGSHWHEPWVAVRNDKFELRNPDSLTFLKPGFNKVDFSFKNTEGKLVSLNDAKYKNKVVIVQLMGTWCPNCMDETKFLVPFYEKYKAQGLEVIALAFERTDDFAKAVSNVERSKKRFNANYDFLITMKTGKDQASEALPMLNAVMAFPTTIYIDKKGVVRKIYTGFNGPATGDAYIKYVEETTLFIEKMLKE